ncbi:MAG: transporter substrate-binding domain-containing protein [Candidatus Borkfalkiaceae bacterium]|nr:transporter substrate-binding domain-containing protein [Christensenellaceae bacterium]
MKKILTFLVTALLAVTACLSFAACGETSDLKRVQDANKLVVGVTVYQPMDYIDDESGEWTGFDADLAKSFAESLGVNCQIVIITWSEKVAELDSKQIDLVWNGMTASDELGKQIDFSVSYAKNAQVAVVKSGSAITTKDQIKNAKIVVEAGSAGATVAQEIGATNVTPLTAQIDALNEVNAGTSEVAIIDITMAQSVVGKGTFSGLKVVEGVSYGDEIFAVGLRKGSDLKEKLDSFLKAKYADGTLATLAEKYQVGLNTEALGA